MHCRFFFLGRIFTAFFSYLDLHWFSLPKLRFGFSFISLEEKSKVITADSEILSDFFLHCKENRSCWGPTDLGPLFTQPRLPNRLLGQDDQYKEGAFSKEWMIFQTCQLSCLAWRRKITQKDSHSHRFSTFFPCDLCAHISLWQKWEGKKMFLPLKKVHSKTS